MHTDTRARGAPRAFGLKLRSTSKSNSPYFSNDVDASAARPRASWGT